MTPGKMNTSLSANVDSSTTASISSVTDADDGNDIKIDTKSESTESLNVRKAINGSDAIAIGTTVSNGTSAAKNESSCGAKSADERNKSEVSVITIEVDNLWPTNCDLCVDFDFRRTKNNCWAR